MRFPLKIQTNSTEAQNTLSLSFIFTNARSINNKLLELQATVRDLSPDLLIIVETWLSSNTPSSVLGLTNYTFLRKDRDGRGGGVLLGWLNTLSVVEVPTLSDSELAAVDLKHSDNNTLRLIVLYNPHGNNVAYLTKLLKTVTELIVTTQRYVIMGDFNLPELFTQKQAKSQNVINPLSSFILSHKPLFQCVDFPTRNDSILDLIFTNDSDIVTELKALPPIGNNDHIALIGKLQCRMLKRKRIVNFKNFRICNYTTLCEFIKLNLTIDKNDLFENAIAHFENSINYAIAKFIPTSKLTIHNNRVLSDSDLKLCKNIRRQYRKYTNTKNEIFLHRYKVLKSKLKSILKLKQCDRENRLMGDSNKLKFFRYIKKALGGTEAPIQIKDSENLLIHSELTSAHMFNSYFAKCFSNTPSANPPVPRPLTNDRTIFSEKLVKESIYYLRRSKGIGHDGIPITFWINVTSVIVRPLTDLFNLCIRNNIYPTKWKTSLIIPLYKKKGSRFCIENYRPISLLPTISKIFEACLYNTLKTIVLPKISRHQHAFKPKSSTTSNLLDTYYYICKSLDKREQIDLITIDFAKAFDRVNHNLLLQKLRVIGVPESLINILCIWLSNRYQIVRVGASLSEPLPVLSGVPQGSILSPLLFSIFLNDLLLLPTNVQIIAYADDLKLIGNAGQNLQIAINNVFAWAQKNDMEININKCETIHFGRNNPMLVYSINGSKLPTSNLIQDLGVNVDSSLNFAKHTLIIKSKCYKLIALLFKCFYSKKSLLYIKFFQIYVMPVIDYGSFLYCSRSASNVKNIESIQRYFTKRLYNRLFPNSASCCYSERLKLFKMSELSVRYKSLDLLILFKITKGSLSSVFSPVFSKRSNSIFIIPPINTSSYRSSFFHRSLTLWNKHAKSLVTTSLAAFYNSLHKVAL